MTIGNSGGGCEIGPLYGPDHNAVPHHDVAPGRPRAESGTDFR
jgi:hypothetical protein